MANQAFRSDEPDKGHRWKSIELASRLHWCHWVVVLGSLVLTLFAWNLAKSQVEDRIQRQFEREAQQTIANIEERLQKYEDALWAGVAFYETLGTDIPHEKWVSYASNISIEDKYPGINGIGVIYRIPAEERQAFETAQQQTRPDFKIYPTHGHDHLYPITYIEPVDMNLAAVGLDIAHEEHRHTAAERARLTQTAQITGPIVLVQDSNQTPGFLFYAPFYAHEDCLSPKHAEDCFKGLVYAPFVVKNLMMGTLSVESRHINIRLRDSGLPLFDELDSTNPDFDTNPMHADTFSINAYGRPWEIDVHTGHSFRSAQKSTQPSIILAGGICIDLMVLTLFFTLARANRTAAQMNKELELKNEELEQYAYSASHDLKSPLFTIQGFAEILKESIEREDKGKVIEYAEQIMSGAKKMQVNIESLLELSRLGIVEPQMQSASAKSCIQDVISYTSAHCSIDPARITISGEATVAIDLVRFKQVMENLICNAFKYAHPDRACQVQIDIAEASSGQIEIRVADNGIGIPVEHRKKAFELFQRISHDSEGTGVGLAIVKRSIESFGGRVWIEDSPLGGVTVCMRVPRAHTQPASHAA
ncbi:MAG: CHASE domain-containing protein [Phycisphaerales bacterium]